MTEEKFIEILKDVWARELSVDEAWEIIDSDRERPDEYSKEYWLPLK